MIPRKKKLIVENHIDNLMIWKRKKCFAQASNLNFFSTQKVQTSWKLKKNLQILMTEMRNYSWFYKFKKTMKKKSLKKLLI